jgi:hypothetical protein
MFRHFLISLTFYVLIIFTSLIVVGIAKEEEMKVRNQKNVASKKESPKKDPSTCQSFKFDRC